MRHNVRGSWVGWIFDHLVSFFSGEWILNWTPYTANGGTVVTARTAWLSFWIYFAAFLLRTTLAEGKTDVIDMRQGIADFVETLPWLATIFGAVYIAFYSRFSSQWTYLANLYNQIVQTQISIPPDLREQNGDLIASWKAGFIEDAEELHLAAKPMFLVAIRNWAAEPLVAQKYALNTVGGAARLNALLDRLGRIAAKAERQRRITATTTASPETTV
jgi:hypothetical protein